MDKPSALEPLGTSPPVEQSRWWWWHQEGRELWLCDLEQSDWAPGHGAQLSDEESVQVEHSKHREDVAWALTYAQV